MKDLILNYIRETSATSRARLVSYYSNEVNEISLLISKIMALQSFVWNGPDFLRKNGLPFSYYETDRHRCTGTL